MKEDGTHFLSLPDLVSHFDTTMCVQTKNPATYTREDALCPARRPVASVNAHLQTIDFIPFVAHPQVIRVLVGLLLTLVTILVCLHVELSLDLVRHEHQ